ncbi:large conductance mechanosensitive channel protein MscL [Metamycoplasma hominis]|nr:MscL family protein [Metamycoplasma hominis]AKJ52341.1 large-conductance mechanosensitive channel [Metamycoplasma hominis]MTH76098.1 MscL family protein [Metamycoplasma hominis]RCJ01153.1 MscL family protein [Metamycoplasma hominis]
MTSKELEEKKHYIKKSYIDAKKIVSRGNMFMLAIGLLLGASFGALVSSLANDVIMSAITKAIGMKNLDAWVVWPGIHATKETGGIFIGKFLGALIQFVIVSTFIFIGLMIVFTIKNSILYAKAKKNPIEEEINEEPAPTTEELILNELKKLNENLLKTKNSENKKDLKNDLK